MRFLSYLLSFLLITTIFPRTAHAIIFLPAIILIPIAKIIALIIGGASLPVLGISTAWSKLYKKPVLRGVIMGIILLFLLATILLIILKVENPSRPLF